MSTIRNYIIVDDDPFNNIFCNIILEDTLGEVNIKTFQVPEKALTYIQAEYHGGYHPTILFLDINMPTLTCWEFMEEFEKFSETIKNQINIYVVSSSDDRLDKDKASANKYIRGFMVKPLEPEAILSIATG